jgi:hypothetical protein
MPMVSPAWIAVALLLTSACYTPDLGSAPGFYCHPTDAPACPDGQRCIAGRCVLPGFIPASVDDLGHAPASADLATPPKAPPDLAKSAADLAAPPDLSVPVDLTAPPDLVPPPPDLACAPIGAACTYQKRALCCTHYCDTTTHTCG